MYIRFTFLRIIILLHDVLSFSVLFFFSFLFSLFFKNELPNNKVDYIDVESDSLEKEKGRTKSAVHDGIADNVE